MHYSHLNWLACHMPVGFIIIFTKQCQTYLVWEVLTCDRNKLAEGGGMIVCTSPNNGSVERSCCAGEGGGEKVFVWLLRKFLQNLWDFFPDGCKSF